MNIRAEFIGKRYGKNWVFRNLNFEVIKGSKVALTGKNGSGKSTLLQILSGYLTPSEGTVIYSNKKADMKKPNAAYIGPYTEIIEEMTVREFLSFHAHFKKPLINIDEMARKASLPLDKFISELSTGMKQRVKLITAFHFENEIIFMDEPTANLDNEGFVWWKEEIQQLESTFLLASNDKTESSNCMSKINLKKNA
ncbi:MAG: ATP-binding cassette domain-containing protein [Ekhidna sp.]|nr:ATP-binding cassette domain-containing protein [Ekhidna sp.]